MNAALGVKIIDYILMALGVLPTLVAKIGDLINLRNRLASGEQIEEAELDALIAVLKKRHEDIQNA